jgi:hypothetical protein
MNTQPNNPPNGPPPPDPLAVALSKLDPAPHGFDWNALMFAAGRASKTRALVFWRIAAGVGALAAFAFAFAYFTQPPTVTERVVFVERPATRSAQPVVAAPTPVPGAQPAPELLPQPLPTTPTPPESFAPPEWSFDPPPDQGAAARWFNMRNEVLTVGLSVLPDNGRKVSAPEK